MNRKIKMHDIKDELFNMMKKYFQTRAKAIRIKHGGWEDSYADGNEKRVLEISEKLKEEGYD